MQLYEMAIWATHRAAVWLHEYIIQTCSGKFVEGWLWTTAADPCPARLLLFWQSCCWSRCLRPVVTGCCRPSLHVSVRQALPDLSSAGGLPAPRRGPPLHHIPSNYWHPAAFEHTGIIVKNSRGQTADGEGWKQQSLSKREKKEKKGEEEWKAICVIDACVAPPPTLHPFQGFWLNPNQEQLFQQQRLRGSES